MKEEMNYPLDIQLFAEDPIDPLTPPSVDVKTPELDYDKLAEAIEKRKSRSEEGAIKGILKEQGLSGAELDEAVKAYKVSKETKANEERERIDNIIKENAEFKKKELMDAVTKEAQSVAKDLKVRDDRFNQLMQLCDKTKFTDEKGVIDKEAMKKELETQLKDVPEFVLSKRIVITKGKGTDVPPEATDAEAYRMKKYGKNKYFKG